MSTAETVAPEATQTATPTPVKKKGGNVLLIILGVILFLCVGVGVLGFVAFNYVAKQATDYTKSLEEAVNEGGNPLTPDETEGETSSVEACALFTEADAEALLGTKVKKDAANNTCSYSTDSDDFTNFGLVTLVVTRSTGSQTAKQLYDYAKNTVYTSDKIEKITLAGADEAVWASDLKQLSFVKGNTWVIISAMTTSKTDVSLSKQAAEKVISRL